MKKKILFVIAAMFVFGLAVVVYSTNFAGDQTVSAASSHCCCCHGDSCPMPAKAADGKETASASCCDKCECCKGDGQSCPMMKKDADGKPMKMEDGKSCPMMTKKGDTAGHAAKGEGAASCPMMKKDADGNAVKMDHAAGMHDMKGHDMKGMT